MAFRKILVPVDFSEHSKAAVDKAVEIAKAFGSEIHLLHCYRIQTGGVSPYGVVLPSNFYEEIREGAQRELDKWREPIAAQDIKVETSVYSDYPPPVIVDTADKIGADLIVIGTRGLSGLKHVLLGSVAERTVQTAHCPVLTVKAPHEDD